MQVTGFLALFFHIELFGYESDLMFLQVWEVKGYSLAVEGIWYQAKFGIIRSAFFWRLTY